MLDGTYRMWWCGGVAGDHILYAEADSLDAPWHARGSTVPGSWNDVFQPTGNPADFDGAHVCDPSVVRVDGTYYMYYGGYPDLALTGQTTRIGVAQSDDGLTWTRLNNGQPIIVPARDWTVLPNPYGPGQPSIIHVNGMFHLIFTDTTGLGGNQGNGAGQYVTRSVDPLFQLGVEELGAAGFAPYSAATHTAFSLVEAFSVDWQYVDTLDAFAVAIVGGGATLRVLLFDQGLQPLDFSTVLLTGSWTEGPAIVSRPDRHAVASPECGRVPLDLIRSVQVSGSGPDGWDLAHSGVDLLTGQTCATAPVPRIFEGSLLVSPGLPLTMVRNGTRLQFGLSAPALRLARTVHTVSSEVFYAIPYGASMTSGAQVLAATGRPGAFLLDDGRLWPVSCLEAVLDNNSIVSSISTTAWDAYPLGPSLYCLR